MKKQNSELRKIIRRVIVNYCDGTWGGLEGATFVEYSEGHNLPQECAQELEEAIISYLENTK